MEKEFGSNFCEKLPVCGRHLKDENGRIFFDTGRSALRYLLDCLGGQIKTVMLPQYDCESVLEVFAGRSCEILFYPVNVHLQLCRERFEQLIKESSPQLILVQAYFGFDTLKRDRDYLNDLRERGIIIVEDITHSVFASNWTVCSDYRFGSIRKWCAIPDGGVLTGAKETLSVRECFLQENTMFMGRRLEAQKKKREYFLNGADDVRKEDFIRLFDESEALLNRQRGYYTMSEYTRTRIAALDREEIVSLRQKNYCVLKDTLYHVHGLKLLFDAVWDDSPPLYFPIYVDAVKRDGLRSYARKKNIFLPLIWQTPGILKEKLEPDVEKIYNEILAIPCDQRYSEQDMFFIAGNIADYMA